MRVIVALVGPVVIKFDVSSLTELYEVFTS